jgi:predicted branched-subunit amino acid permease
VNRATVTQSLSVSFTVGLYGTAFGAASIAAGFSLLQTSLLSLRTFSGIATASLLGIRNGLYGLRMAPILKVRGVKRVIAAQVTIDESTGVAIGQEDLGTDAMKAGFWLTGFGVYIFWNFFTILGALGAQAMGNPSAWGLDAAVPAAFLGLVWPRLHGKYEKGLAALSLLIAVALSPVISAGLPIIATALLAVAFGWKARS